MRSNPLSEKVTRWYHNHKRKLPWRDSKDPYRIWLSEIILQQTRIEQGLPYYKKFVSEFPTVSRLASASEGRVLELWQGLGYYTRARNMLKCARVIVRSCKGRFPSSYEELRTLPGIGDYTAAAIASMAFDEPVAAIDGNVLRVLSRLFGNRTPINTARGKKTFFAIAQGLIPKKKPGLHNQALMEFGALHCTPRNPACPSCILKNDCAAYSGSQQKRLPNREKRKPPVRRYIYYFVIRKNRSILMRRRNENDIWRGLYDFVAIERNKTTSAYRVIDEILRDTRFSLCDPTFTSPVYRHVLSHQIIHSQFILMECSKSQGLRGGPFRFYSQKKIAKLPKPALINRFLADYRLF